jgi:Tfp pilus assembly protein PilE
MKNLCTPKCQGIGLIDLMLAVIIASLLMAAAAPAYDQIIDRARVARAIGDIGSISIAIERFGIKNNGLLPNSLDELLMDVPFDPSSRLSDQKQMRLCAGLLLQSSATTGRVPGAHRKAGFPYTKQKSVGNCLIVQVRVSGKLATEAVLNQITRHCERSEATS